MFFVTKIRTSIVVSAAIMSFAFGNSAHAQRVSGGGNVIECLKVTQVDPIKHSGNGSLIMPFYTLLDYYDAKRPGGYGFDLDLGPGKTNEEKIKYVLDRLEKVDPFRANLYRKHAAEFESRMILSDAKSWGTPSNDLGSGYFLEENCTIRRLAILRSEQEVLLSGNSKAYEVSNLWETLDETTKAGIKLHEIAYGEAMVRGASDSLSVRRYVALISSRQVLTADYKLEILKSGLVFWGEQAPDYENFDSYHMSVRGFPTFFNEEFPPGNSWATGNGKVISFDSLPKTKNVVIYLDSLKLECHYLRISDVSNTNNSSVSKLVNIYNDLASKKGISLSNLPERVNFELGGCGDIKISSQ